MVALLTNADELSGSSPDQVRDGYRHVRKRVVRQDAFVFANCRLKRYEIAFEGRPIPTVVEHQVDHILQDEIESGRLTIGDEFGFVVVHDCELVLFAIVSTWRGNNELWQTVYVRQKSGTNDEPFTKVVYGAHKPTFCVWELGVVSHEAHAWSRYLRSDRLPADQERYMDDLCDGYV